MSEKLSHHSPEQQEALASKEVLEKQQETLKQNLEKHAEHARHTHVEKLHEIRHEAAKEAQPAHETHKKLHETEKRENEQPMFVNRELKDMAYRRTLKRTQAQLSLPARTFSKVIHNRTLEVISEKAASTVARPSGILAGGIVSLLGSSLFLWVSKHYGYEYNYLLFALFFLGGFFVGLLIEIGYRLLIRRSR